MSFAARVKAARPLGGPRFLDRRFDSAGNPVSCPGNTIIRHISHPADLDRLCEAQDKLRLCVAGYCVAWLPRASLHCTLFNGLLYADRDAQSWPTTLPNDASRKEADAHMQEAFRKTKPPTAPAEMEIAGFSGLTSDALGLSLVPTPSAERALRAYRDDLAEAAGLRDRPGHESYVFHITLGYVIAWPDLLAAEAFDKAMTSIAQDLARIPLTLPVQCPEFCLFDHLDHFDVLASVTP